ncbi:MAG: GntR family transcriptional regulator [Clostridia bacterium]|nr:GntR family transcriptional regulator [Clostridia bacterium]
MTEGKLRSESVSPLYAQIMERIRQDIFLGTYPIGSRIPAESELEIRYNGSRVTVRRALQELTAAGLLERKQGKGTFVDTLIGARSRAITRKLRSIEKLDSSEAENLIGDSF